MDQDIVNYINSCNNLLEFLKYKFMTEISFYHLSSTSFEKALPKLLEKIIALNKRSLILANQEDVKKIDEILWTYSTRSFLPHATNIDDFKSDQPIYITSNLEKINNASILIVTNDTIIKEEGFERIIDLFDGNIDENITNADLRIKYYNDKNYKISYYKQQSNGSWIQE